MPLTTADCAALSDLFTRESGRIVPSIQKRMMGKNVLIDRIDRGPFPDGMGYQLNVMTVERSITSDADDAAWTAITPSTGSGNAACLPATSQLTTGQTLRQFQLYRKAVESQDICLEDLRTDFQIAQQLGITVDNMGMGVQWELEKHAINEYMANSNYWLTANSLFPNYITTAQQTFDAAFPPTSGLTQGMLDQIYMALFRDSFGDGAFGRSGAAFIYALICSPEVSRSLIKDNADIRQDFRYAFEGDRLESELLRPYGVDRSYGNYAHIPYAKMPRYDYVNGAYVRRSYWDASPSATKGKAPVVNALYLAAQYEVSIVFNPLVYKWLVPGALNSPGGTTRFSTPDYFPATVKWLNIPDIVCNPDGTIGRFRAVLASASMPIHPEYGYIVLHKRCAPLLNETNCAAS